MQDLEDLIHIIAQINDEDLLMSLFKELFTPAEIKAFSLRWKLLKELSRGKTQREIAAELGISLCKITRGSKLLKKADSAFREILKQYPNNYPKK